MNIYLSKAFTRLARRDGLTDVHICQAIDEMKALKRLTKYYLTLKPAEIKATLQCGELREVNYNEKRT
ncbi:hypothetical protein ES705_37357 [subsurface metagenome]